ncbi:MAG: hypothetical protein GY717_10690 [Rhodobacteraceae bacterium]|nr:hypothetical protein [Paracoccaceae bacterium]
MILIDRRKTPLLVGIILLVFAAAYFWRNMDARDPLDPARAEAVLGAAMAP